MDNSQKTLEILQIEVGKLRIDVNDIRDNHLRHLRNSINLIFVFLALILAETGIVIALVALRLG